MGAIGRIIPIVPITHGAPPMDFRTRGEIAKGYWVEERSTIPCILPKDGLLAIFQRKDIEAFLDKTYPGIERYGERVWFFNSSRDREIAETQWKRVYANPQVLLQHFMGAK